MTPRTPAIANTASQRVGSLMTLRPRLLALWLCGALAPSRVNPSSLWGEPVFEEGGGNKETAALPTLRPRSAEGPVHPPHFERTERPREEHLLTTAPWPSTRCGRDSRCVENSSLQGI